MHVYNIYAINCTIIYTCMKIVKICILGIQLLICSYNRLFCIWCTPIEILYTCIYCKNIISVILFPSFMWHLHLFGHLPAAYCDIVYHHTWHFPAGIPFDLFHRNMNVRKSANLRTVYR